MRISILGFFIGMTVCFASNAFALTFDEIEIWARGLEIKLSRSAPADPEQIAKQLSQLRVGQRVVVDSSLILFGQEEISFLWSALRTIQRRQSFESHGNTWTADNFLEQEDSGEPDYTDGVLTEQGIVLLDSSHTFAGAYGLGQKRFHVHIVDGPPDLKSVHLNELRDSPMRWIVSLIVGRYRIENGEYELRPVFGPAYQVVRLVRRKKATHFTEIRLVKEFEKATEELKIEFRPRDLFDGSPIEIEKIERVLDLLESRRTPVLNDYIRLLKPLREAGSAIVAKKRLRIYSPQCDSLFL